MADSAECPICLSEKDGSELCVTTCSHTFCTHCFTRSLGSSEVGARMRRGRCPMCREPVSLYSTRRLQCGQMLLAPACESIVGEVYTQGRRGCLGVASYHFDTLEQTYISYAAALPEWRLDDGSAPPERKYFEETSYDGATRTFRGIIRWEPVPFNGASRWEYEMVFADSFGFICAGQLKTFDASGNELKSEIKFREQLHYNRYRAPPSSIIGCAYVQGGRLGVASYHFPRIEQSALGADDGPYISYASPLPGWRLDDGNMPPERKPFVNPTYDAASRTFRGTIRWEPTTFGGDSVWEYEMVFADDFGVIDNGVVTAFGRDGKRKGAHRFGVQLHYELVDEESEEMLGSEMLGSGNSSGGPWVVLRLPSQAQDFGAGAHEMMADAETHDSDSDQDDAMHSFFF